jgi:hypothetical protein
MLRESVRHLEGKTTVEKIYFVLFDGEAFSVFKEVFAEMKSTGTITN